MIDTKEASYLMGTFGGNVPMTSPTSPRGPQAPREDGIDLASIPDAVPESGEDPP